MNAYWQPNYSLFLRLIVLRSKGSLNSLSQKYFSLAGQAEVLSCYKIQPWLEVNSQSSWHSASSKSRLSLKIIIEAWRGQCQHDCFSAELGLLFRNSLVVTSIWCLSSSCWWWTANELCQNIIQAVDLSSGFCTTLSSCLSRINVHSSPLLNL